jgi:hypothetical protein
MWNKGPKPMTAIGRLANPFMYETQMFFCGGLNPLVRLDEYLNAQARDGWKLHTIERVTHEAFFCVWEKLDYGEKKGES